MTTRGYILRHRLLGHFVGIECSASSTILAVSSPSEPYYYYYYCYCYYYKIVKFEHPSPLFSSISSVDFEQVCVCSDVIFTSVRLCNCLSILNFIVYRFIVKSSKAVIFLLNFFSTEFCTILTQFDGIQDGMKFKAGCRYDRAEITVGEFQLV